VRVIFGSMVAIDLLTDGVRYDFHAETKGMRYVYVGLRRFECPC
jgi:hypothetical protein